MKTGLLQFQEREPKDERKNTRHINKKKPRAVKRELNIGRVKKNVLGRLTFPPILLVFMSRGQHWILARVLTLLPS